MGLLSGKKTFVYLLIAAVIVLGGAGFIVWARSNDPPADNNSTSQQPPAENNNAEPKTPDQYADWKTYEDPAGRYSFKYPKEWQVLKCSDDAHEPFVYFGSDKRNLGVDGDNPSILCGGGTDFPPQAAIAVYPPDNSGNLYATEHEGDQVTIDGVSGVTYREVADGSELRQKDFVTVVYQIKANNQLITIVYNQWPSGFSDDYDTDPANERIFETIVTQTLDIKI